MALIIFLFLLGDEEENVLHISCRDVLLLSISSSFSLSLSPLPPFFFFFEDEDDDFSIDLMAFCSSSTLLHCFGLSSDTSLLLLILLLVEEDATVIIMLLLLLVVVPLWPCSSDLGGGNGPALYSSYVV